MNTNKTKKGQLVLPSKENLRMGASGGIGFIGGANIVSAGRQILKSGLGKGAINYVKNIFSKKTPVGSGPSRGGNFNEIANQKLREGLNKTKVPKSKPRTTSIPNPIPNSTKAYNKLQYPMGKKAFSSKPVEFMGPNPANKIGAGKNSYPR